MALPKKKVPQDPPEVIRARERLRPVDDTIVLCKNAAGTLMMHVSGCSPIPWPHAIPEEIALRLKNGVVDAWTFKWIWSRERMMSMEQGVGQWELVKRKSNEVYVPFAYGDMTDNLYHRGDQILHKRPLTLDEHERSDQQSALSINRLLAGGNDALTEELSSLGATKVTSDFFPVEEDSVTLSQSTVDGGFENE